MAYTPTAWHDKPVLDTPLNSTNLNKLEGGVQGAHNLIAGHETRIVTLEGAPTPAAAGTMPGYIYLDSYTGTDDDKLTAAMADAQAATYHPTIRLSNRAHTFTLQRTLFDGFRLEGPPGYSNAEKGPANMTCLVTLNGGNAWLTAPASVATFDVYIGQIAFKGTSSTQFMASSATQPLYCILLRDLSFSGFKSVLGSQAAKMLITAAQFDGYWEVNNSYNGAIHLGGSDNTLWPAGMLLDSATAYLSPGGSNGQYHLWLDGLEKTSIGPIYITAEGGWGGIHITGAGIGSTSNNQGGPLVFSGGMKCEGRNAGAPCNGSLVRIDGGIVVLRDAWISYGMASPATPGHNPQDAGIVHQTAGQLVMSGCTYDTATGVVETVPFLYGAGGEARISAQMRASKGGVWTGLPRYQAAGGTINADTSVQSV